jgi:hypothetical protein
MSLFIRGVYAPPGNDRKLADFHGPMGRVI